MNSSVYAVVNIGNVKLFVGDASQLSTNWKPIFTQLNLGTYPHPLVQIAWKQAGNKRRFSFHSKEDLINDSDIIGLKPFN